MLEFQKRVVKEWEDLEGKIEALGKFRTTEQFYALDQRNRSLLERQHLLMERYSDILSQRIDIFEVK